MLYSHCWPADGCRVKPSLDCIIKTKSWGVKQTLTDFHRCQKLVDQYTTAVPLPLVCSYSNHEDGGCLLKDPLCILMMFSEGKGHWGDTKRANSGSLLSAEEPWIAHGSHRVMYRRLHLNTVARSSKSKNQWDKNRLESLPELGLNSQMLSLLKHIISAAFWSLIRRPQNSPQCQQILGHQPIGATGFVYFLSHADLRKMGTWRGKTGLTTCPCGHIPKWQFLLQIPPKSLWNCWNKGQESYKARLLHQQDFLWETHWILREVTYWEFKLFEASHIASTLPAVRLCHSTWTQ